MVAQARVYGDGSFVSSLGLSNAGNCHSKKPKPSKPKYRKGLKGITSEAKRLIRTACAIQENKYGRSNVSFATLTVPTLRSPEDHITLNQNWSELVRQFMQALGRLLDRRGLDGKGILVVCEIQPGRWKKYGIVAPHLHCTFQGRKSRYSHWGISPKELDQIWGRCLQVILGWKPDCRSACNIQQVKKSLKRYLAKYMSKGGDILKQIIHAGMEDQVPPSWYRMSDNLRKKVHDSIQRLSEKATEFIIDNADLLVQMGVLSWYRWIEIDLSDYQSNFEYKKKVAMVGGFNDSKPIDDHIALIESIVA